MQTSGVDLTLFLNEISDPGAELSKEVRFPPWKTALAAESESKIGRRRKTARRR
jgi:hypothetical protein